MPTISLNRKSLNKLVGKTLTEQELKEKVPMIGVAFEGMDREEVEIEVFPNRPDMLSEAGMARALRTFLGIKKGMYIPQVKRSGEKVIIEDSVKGVRPYTVCALIKNLQFDDEKIREIVQLQEKLHVTYGRNRKKCAIGIYPLEKIEMPIYYRAKKPKDINFQPLDGKRKMNAQEIMREHVTGKAYGRLLKNVQKYPVFMDVNDSVLSMPPLVNSEETGRVTTRTREVFIECSGHNFEVLSICLNMIVYALSDMGGDIYSMDLHYGKKKITTPQLKPKEMKIDIPYVNKRIGLELKEKDVKKYLEKMGHDYKNGKAIIPSYRADIMHQIDLAEEVAIGYGYENLKAEIPKVATIGEEDKEEIFKRKLVQVMVGLGFLEMNTYNLTSEEATALKMNTKIPFITLANAVNTEYNVLRPWVLPSLMHILSENKHNDYPQRIFGTGKIFKKDKDKKSETGVKEETRMAVAICDKNANYTLIKQVLDSLFNALGEKYETKEAEHSSFIPGRVGRISCKGKDIAYIGEVHPQVLTNWALDTPVAALELNITELLEKLK